MVDTENTASPAERLVQLRIRAELAEERNLSGLSYNEQVAARVEAFNARSEYEFALSQLRNPTTTR